MRRVAVAAALAVAACADHGGGPGVHVEPHGIGADPAAPIPAPLVAPGPRLPTTVTPLGYALRLELAPDREGFAGHVEIRVRVAAPTTRIWLHADVAIGRAQVGDAAATVRTVAHSTMVALEVARPVGPGELTLALDYTGRTDRDQQGLFRQQYGGAWYLYSQGEPALTREITPCFDEPQWKTPWHVTLVVPARPELVAAGNTAIAHERTLPDGRRELELADTPPMASHLLAVALGPFEVVPIGALGRGHVPARLLVLAGEATDTQGAARGAVAAIDALERYFDEPLPWGKLDIVAVPTFFGGMENPGLVTLLAADVIGGTDDREHYNFQISLLAHELAHFWMGDSVTPAWWDDLWIAESFASYLADEIVRELGATGDFPLRLALVRGRALAADRAPDTRALRPVMPAEPDPDSPFDAISYDKGEVVLGMFAHAAGGDAMRTALRAFVRAHVNGTAVADDLLAAFADATTPAFASALRSYLVSPGAPVIEVERRCTSDTLVLDLRVDGPQTVPLCLRYLARTGPASRCEQVAGPRTLPLHDAAGCGAWVVANAGGLGYYITEWQGGVPQSPRGTLTEAEQVAVGDDVAAAIARGDLDSAAANRAIAELAVQPERAAQLAAISAATARDALHDDDRAAELAGALVKQLGAARVTALLTTPAHGDLERQLVIALLELVPGDRLPPPVIAHARAVIDHELAAKPAAIVAARLPTAFAAAGPAGGRKLVDRVLAKLHGVQTTELRDALYDGLGRTAPTEIPYVVDHLRANPDDSFAAIEAMFDHRTTRAPAWTALHATGAIAAMSPAHLRRLIELSGALCTAPARAEVADQFAAAAAASSDAQILLAHALALIDQCVARRAMPR